MVSVTRRWPTRRLALGLTPTPGPGMALVLLGVALGPNGLGVLSEPALRFLDPAVFAALAALGVLVGLHINVREPRQGHLAVAAVIESGVTILVVGLGVAILLAQTGMTVPTPWPLALLLGICAVPSSTAAEVSGEPSDVAATRIRDFGDVLPLVLGVLVTAWMLPGSLLGDAKLLAQAGLIAVAMAFATWLLVTQTSSESEQRVFTIGALLLLGGAAAYLSLSAPLVGLLAGIFWNATGRVGRDRIARDMRYLQHPLLLLLLLFAGARLSLSIAVVGLVVAYVVFRIAGKLAGGWLAVRVSAQVPRDLRWSPTAPGVIAVAMAVDALLAGGGTETGTMLFTIVIAGSLVSELLSWLASPADRRA